MYIYYEVYERDTDRIEIWEWTEDYINRAKCRLIKTYKRKSAAKKWAECQWREVRWHD